MLTGIDHLVIAVADPDAAASELERRSDSPGGGGRHDRLGTFNRLIWLGDTYLELIGVFDPEARGRLVGRRAGAPRPRRGGGLATWAVATDDIERTSAVLRDAARTWRTRHPASASDRMVASSWRLAAPPRLDPTFRRSSSSTTRASRGVDPRRPGRPARPGRGG